MTEFPLVNATIFAGLGILIFFAAVAVAARIAPFAVWKQVAEERNTAAAILAGAALLALGWIVAAAMH
jgi:uncharacterized membrane protein YjfL (UPF0719 family)